MDDQASESRTGALRSERARATPFACPDVSIGVIAMTSATVVQGLTGRANIAIRSITPHMRTRDSIHGKRSPYFSPERFTYEAEHDSLITVTFSTPTGDHTQKSPDLQWSVGVTAIHCVINASGGVVGKVTD